MVDAVNDRRMDLADGNDRPRAAFGVEGTQFAE
jgi:hypothetical protein